MISASVVSQSLHRYCTPYPYSMSALLSVSPIVISVTVEIAGNEVAPVYAEMIRRIQHNSWNKKEYISLSIILKKHEQKSGYRAKLHILL